MLDSLLGTVLENGTFTGTSFLIVTIVSLILGAVIAFFYTGQTKASKSFAIALALIPAIVQLVILLVNGNIGAGVAVAGAFSLVRSRSAAGKAQEITAIFLAMAVGLATGMGYIGIAAIFAVVISLLLMLMNKLFAKKESGERILKITVPENLEFDGVFENTLGEFTDSYELTGVKTVNMGSLYKLTYRIRMKSGKSLKDFIDTLRVQNGNLEISCGHPDTKDNEL